MQLTQKPCRFPSSEQHAEKISDFQILEGSSVEVQPQPAENGGAQPLQEAESGRIHIVLLEAMM